MKHYFSVRHYISVLKRKPAHIQHVVALTVAGFFTAIFALLILYFDYGFFNDSYSRKEDIGDTAIRKSTTESPTSMFGTFFREAQDRFRSIPKVTNGFFESSEVYKKEE